MKKQTERNMMICNMYTEQYKSTIEIGKYFKISRQRVYQILAANGIKTDRASRHLPERLEREKSVMQAIEEGKSYRDIEREGDISVPRTTVMRIVNQNR